MQKKKIYISGQISGLTRPEYVANFLEAARLLNAQGYDVVNPLEKSVQIDPSRRKNVTPFVEIRLTLGDEIKMTPVGILCR